MNFFLKKMKNKESKIQQFLSQIHLDAGGRCGRRLVVVGRAMAEPDVGRETVDRDSRRREPHGVRRWRRAGRTGEVSKLNRCAAGATCLDP
jgi:hypothetical protein